MGKIKIEGEFHEFGEDNNYHIITVDEDHLLDTISDKTIANYARWTLNMIPEADTYTSLNDFSEGDIVAHLRNDWFNFINEVGEEEMIEHLERRGYNVLENNEVSGGLDHIDAPMFEEIQQKFLNASWEQRKAIYNKIMKL